MFYVTQRFVLAANARLGFSLLGCRQAVKHLACPRLQLFSSDSSGNINSKAGAKPTELKAKFITDDPRMSARERLKRLFAVYGPTAVVLHISLSLSFLGITYLIVRYGFDVPAFLQRNDLLNDKYMMIIANGGTFALAYALYKAQMPFRVLVTLFLTPVVARRLHKFGIIKRKF